MLWSKSSDQQILKYGLQNLVSGKETLLKDKTRLRHSSDFDDEVLNSKWKAINGKVFGN